MMPKATRDPIEIRLRAALEDLRPPDGAPATLRARVDAVPEHGRRLGRGARLRAFATSTSAVAAVVGVAAIAILAASFSQVVLHTLPGVDVPGGGPTAVAFDPSIEGPGLLRHPIWTLLIAQAVLVAATALVVGRTATRWRTPGAVRTRRAWTAPIVVGIVATGAIALSFQTPLTVTGSSGPVLGYDVNLSSPPGSNGPSVYYSTAVPGGPTIALFEVWNFGVLPVQLDGLVTDLPAGERGPSWIALALPTIPDTFPNRLDQLRPFAPITLAPNTSVPIYLVGRAGICAYGPGFQPGASAVVTGYSSPSRDLRLGYSILGLSSVTTVQMPMQLVEPDAAHCP
jgi:hypothetical protein